MYNASQPRPPLSRQPSAREKSLHLHLSDAPHSRERHPREAPCEKVVCMDHDSFCPIAVAARRRAPVQARRPRSPQAVPVRQRPRARAVKSLLLCSLRHRVAGHLVEPICLCATPWRPPAAAPLPEEAFHPRLRPGGHAPDMGVGGRERPLPEQQKKCVLP